MASMITRCPHCATAFHITADHLRSANGSVRCGSCLAVFNGLQNLTQSPDHEKQAEEELFIHEDTLEEETSDSTDQLPSHNDTAAIANKQAASLSKQEASPSKQEPSPSKQEASPGNQETSPSNQEASFGKQETAPNERHKQTKDLTTDVVPEEEAWALKLLEEEGHDPEHIGLVPAEKNEQASSTPRIHEQLDSDDSPPPQRNVTREPTRTPEKMVHTKNALTGNPPAPGDPREQEMPADTPPLQDTTPQALLNEFEPEPLVVAIQSERKIWSSAAAWTALTLLAVIGITTQIAIQQFDELSNKKPYRQFYAVACKHLGCELLAFSDRKSIKTSQLKVRTHPYTLDALMVDVILQNNADFEQTFPSLVLTFRDLKNAVVAQRAFKPHEYLGGELTGIDLMPRKQPIHIALEIVDPGNGAVSYDIQTK